ncbi:MAG: enoyl-CoA hydratase [Solirubrobacteraceae bacterium]
MEDTTAVLMYDVADRIATITLNRPAARNALNIALRNGIPEALRRADADPGVDAVILTGADPAFCAGFDLKELGASRSWADTAPASDGGTFPPQPNPVPVISKPLIGAINGVAAAGGFELALNCHFLVASERASFADTHSRVGVMPWWGLTVLLAQAVGVRKARELSLTGNYLSAHEALQFRLVNHVVAHEELIPMARRLATDIVNNDRDGVRQMLATYHEVSRTTVAEAWDIEWRVATEWQRRAFDASEIERRRASIVARGRAQND